MPSHALATFAIFMMITAPLGLFMLSHFAMSRLEKVFPDNEWGVWQQGRLYIEDFYNKSDVYPQRMVEHLGCSISFIQLEGNHSIEQFYKMCAKNLHKAAPSLRFLSLNGGYIYNPGNLTVDELKSEMAQLHDYFKSIMHVFHRQQWNLANFDFNGVIVMDKESVNTLDFTSIVESAFGTKTESNKSEKKETKFKLNIYNSTINVFLSLSDAEMFEQAPRGRSKFYLPRMRIGIPPEGRQ